MWSIVLSWNLLSCVQLSDAMFGVLLRDGMDASDEGISLGMSWLVLERRCRKGCEILSLELALELHVEIISNGVSRILYLHTFVMILFL